MQRKEKYRMPSYNNNNFVLNCRGKWGTQTCGKSSGFDPVGQQKAATAVIDQGDGLSLACTTDKKAQRVRIEMDTHGEDSKDLHLTEKYNMLHIAKVGMLPSEKNHGNRCLWDQNLGFWLKSITHFPAPHQNVIKECSCFLCLLTWQEIIPNSCETPRQRWALKCSGQFSMESSGHLSGFLQSNYSQQWDINQLHL